MKKRTRIEFLISEQEKAIIQQHADELGINIASFIRKAVDRYIWEREEKKKNGD